MQKSITVSNGSVAMLVTRQPRQHTATAGCVVCPTVAGVRPLTIDGVNDATALLVTHLADAHDVHVGDVLNYSTPGVAFPISVVGR